MRCLGFDSRRREDLRWTRRALVLGLTACAGWAAVAEPATLELPGAKAHAGLHGSVNGRPPGYLGILFHDAAAENARSRGPHGVEVVMVDHDGPAGKAGLQPHDILLSLNGQAIAGREALRRMIHDAGAGVDVVLGVLRSGRALTLTARLADRDTVERAAMARLAASSPPLQPPVTTAEADGSVTGAPETPPAEMQPSPPPGPAPVVHGQSFLGSVLHSGPFTGMMLDAMEPQLATYFGAPQGVGLLVQSVTPGSPAAVAGLRAGDVLLRADQVALRTPSDWSKRVHAAKGRPMALSVLRERREMTVTLQPELKHHSLLEWPLF